MNTTAPSSPLRRLAAPAATVAAAALAVQGVVQITDTQSSQTTTVGIEHLTLAALSLTALALIPVVLFLGRLAGGSRGAIAAPIGMAVLAALVTVSNVRGEDPSFFPAVAVPSNLLWLGGLVAIAVALKRSGRVPTALAVALPFTWFFAFPLSMFGGGLVSGAYWLVVAWMIRHGELPRRTPAAAAAAAAARA